MDNETTQLLNENIAPKEQNNEQPVTNDETSEAMHKKSKKGRTAAAAVSGFVAGAAVGVGATAAAQTQTQTQPLESAEEIVDKADDSSESTKEVVVAPEPEQAILANDEGIRYAHVDADNFNDAFAQARTQVGPGGVFEYNGKIYATYVAEEWNEMSAQERADFQSKVFETTPSHHTPHSHSQATETVTAHNEVIPESHTETEPNNEEMIAAEPADNEIRVLGVEAVQNEYGQIMNVALVENNGDQALLIDVDNNGTIDVLLQDDSGDGEIQESEVYDISGSGLEVADLLQAQAAGQGDVYYASNDDMPDYINDADSFVEV